jgi:hypothetical protein
VQLALFCQPIYLTFVALIVGLCGLPRHRTGLSISLPTCVRSVLFPAPLDSVYSVPTPCQISWFESNGASPPVFTEHVVTTTALGADSVALVE